MIDPQSMANDIRDRITDNPAIRRVGLELLWAAGTTSCLTVRVRHRDHILDVERGGSWTGRTPAELADELVHELIAEALGNRRPSHPVTHWSPGPIGHDPLHDQSREPRWIRGRRGREQRL